MSHGIKKNLIHSLSADEKNRLAQGKKGIEREAIRILKNDLISNQSHQKYFGSALCHSYFTTDFSESLLEIITPPFTENNDLVNFLEKSHQYISESIYDEKLWPASMPPNFQNRDFQIAEYGNSNIAKFKTLYRKGLSKRYGKPMQAISGVHFNYSLPEIFWKLNSNSHDQDSSTSNRNIFYFNIIRNISRFGWLILYLFGASPILNKTFLSSTPNGSKIFKDNIYFPYATSLRMSHLGYQNDSQADIEVSINSIDEYIFDLLNLTSEKSNKFKIKIPSEKSELLQLNDFQLQIEDEYYSMIRPKSMSNENIRPTSKLKKYGVEYIEIRSLDIDPWSPIGISESTMNFIEALILYSSFCESPPISNSEYKTIRENNHLVATIGRQPNLNLEKDGKKITLKEWASYIVDEMEPFLDILSISELEIKNYKDMISDPETTPSARLINEVLEGSYSLDEFMVKISEKNKEYFLSMDKKTNEMWEKFDEEFHISLDKQKKLEQQSEISFKNFLDNYLNS